MMLVEMVHGSRLYGTHSEMSDYDYKGVAMPTASHILRGQIPKIIEKSERKKEEGEKNRADDVEREIYSLHYFIDLCLQGQTVALDMLHAPTNAIQDRRIGQTGFLMWHELTANRHRFYTKKMTALVGYARHQAAKYGIKGSRLAAAKKVYGFLDAASRANPEFKMKEIWNLLPTGEHIHFHLASLEHNNIALYEVCGMKLQATGTPKHYLPTLLKFIDNYGNRAKLAESNQGIDWKAVSHAFRAGYQMKHILQDGGFSYPLPETRFLIDIKQGIIPYADAGPQLEKLIDEVEHLAEISNYPDEPDKEWAYDFLERCSRDMIAPVRYIDNWHIQG